MNLNRRNYPPEHGIRVPAEEIRALLVSLFVAVDMPEADADLLAGILTRNNERCLYSHGTGQVPYYLEKIRSGAVNPRPQVRVVQEAAASLVMDGDGGLGYFPCHQGTLQIIAKAKAGGVAALTTSNHHHVGSAGNYTRLAVEHDCIGLCGSSYRNHLAPESLIYEIVDASPISLALPAGQEPPVVMDMGGRLLNFQEELFERIPTAYFKTMALTAVVKGLAGVFPGIFREALADSPWDIGQGAFVAVIDVAHFMPIDELKAEMDRFIGEARQARPLPGMERAELAGGNEWQWARDSQQHGVPMSDEHVQSLQAEAEALAVETTWSAYEHTRF
jgi:LDH2 family malate/lactate/ureidoglycolate dehydrogenase